MTFYPARDWLAGGIERQNNEWETSMQAIIVKYHGPTDTKGARMSARCDAGRVTVPWDHALSIGDNKRAACLALLRKLGWWESTYHGGVLPDGSWAFVCDDAWPRVRLVKS